MSRTKDQIMDEAIRWTVRLREADAGAWEEFTGWLEADPEHLLAYEEVASLDAALGEIEPQRAPAAVIAEARPRPLLKRRALLGGAAAAMAAAAAWFTLLSPAATYAVGTGPGERQSIALEGGTRIDLNGDSRIVLDRGDSRFARLERGEALFTVAHQPGNPFRVEAGEAVIRNIGTVFNVTNEGGSVAVEVAEGGILFASQGEEVRVGAGGTVRSAPGRIETGKRDAATIGGWRQGQLSYSSATLADIARDLSRSSGHAVSASPEVAQQRFSGVIVVDKDPERMRRRVSALLDVDVRLAGKGWILAPPDR